MTSGIKAKLFCLGSVPTHTQISHAKVGEATAPSKGGNRTQAPMATHAMPIVPHKGPLRSSNARNWPFTKSNVSLEYLDKGDGQLGVIQGKKW